MEWEMLRPFIIPTIGCIATYVILVKKLEFEITYLKEESRKHAAALEAIERNGSMATVQVDKRVVKLEEEFADMKRTLDDMRQTLTRNEAAMSEVKSGLAEIKSFMNTQVERRNRRK
ncbi:MAG: hypothetical protein LBH85_01240 [Treponema sp.]|jgi:uncharacterized coiled-coil protein SlyX|nr:hypothetical protein [Treponema sp.]